MIIMSVQHHHHHDKSGAFSRESKAKMHRTLATIETHRGPDLRRESWLACGVTGDEPLLQTQRHGTCSQQQQNCRHLQRRIFLPDYYKNAPSQGKKTIAPERAQVPWKPANQSALSR